jgi:uncharacterized protein (TIGR03067 family)
MRTCTSLALLLLTTSLALAACGDDSGGGPDAGTPLADAAEPPVDAAAPPDAAAPDVDAAPVAENPIIGAYLVTAINGEAPAGDPQNWTFGDGTLHVESGAHGVDGTYTYDDTLDPKQIDLVSPNGTVAGIYRFNEDLTILEIKAGGNGNTERPTNFDIDPTTSDLVEFTRQ